jgi:hypothetical protein
VAVFLVVVVVAVEGGGGVDGRGESETLDTTVDGRFNATIMKKVC